MNTLHVIGHKIRNLHGWVAEGPGGEASYPIHAIKCGGSFGFRGLFGIFAAEMTGGGTVFRQWKAVGLG